MAAGASSRPTPSDQPAAIGPGRIVLVVGPSGAGKDAILQEARKSLAGDDRFVFPRRVVTRDANAAEDHLSLSRAAFGDQLVRGAFALHWQAHGLYYGIPAEADEVVCSGKTIVLNASRSVIGAARARYASAVVVLIEAPLETRVARLAKRNRERPEEVSARLQRVVAGFSGDDADLTIDNTGTLEQATDLLVDWLVALH